MKENQQNSLYSIAVLLIFFTLTIKFLCDRIHEFFYFQNLSQVKTSNGYDWIFVLLWDLFLLILFEFQKEKLNSQTFKNFYDSFFPRDTFPTTIILSNIFCLWTLRSFWATTPYIVLWKLSSSAFYTFFPSSIILSSFEVFNLLHWKLQNSSYFSSISNHHIQPGFDRIIERTKYPILLSVVAFTLSSPILTLDRLFCGWMLSFLILVNNRIDDFDRRCIERELRTVSLIFRS